MKYTPPYRFETGSIFEYSEEHGAYVHISKKINATAQEIAGYHIANADFELKYDTWCEPQN